ncbi:MAG: O-antigen ligase family protein [Methylococcales bacterium]|nr:O-antigen ligase family protein [Methylococcales bacterium]
MITFSSFSEKSLNTCRYLTILAAVAAPISTALTSITMVALLIVWLISGQAIQTLKQSWQQPVGKMIVLFVVWLLIGTIYADTDWHIKLITLLSWKKLLIAYVLLGIFQQREWQKRFVYWYLIAMLIAAIIGFSLWFLDLQIRPSNGAEAGIFMTNHATQSMAFVAALLCCIFLIPEFKDTPYRYYIWAAIGLFLFNIFFISSARSGYLAVPFAATFAVGSIYGFRKLPHIAALVAVASLVFGLTSNTLQDRMKLAIDEQTNYQTSSAETSVGIRVIFYKNTWELIKERPWFGYGTSSFKSVYSPLAATKSQDWRGGGTADPHNQYLFVWLENGLFGLILFFAYIYIGIRQGLNNKPYGAIAASFLVAIAASSLFNSHFKTFAEGHLLAFFLGALLCRPITENSKPLTNA